MKKVLYVIPYPKFFSQHAGVGGHVAHAAGIVQGFVDQGYEVTVVTEEEHEIFQQASVTVHVVPCSSQSMPARQLWALKLLKQIKLLLKTAEFDYCYIRYSASFSPWLPYLKNLLKKTPLILEINSLGSQWHNYLRFLDRRALRSADRVICISETLKGFVNQLLVDTSGTDIRVVINGVNPERFNVEPEKLGDNSYIHAGFAGLLKADYGVETLIEAGRDLLGKPIVIHIFGDGPYRGDLEASASDLDNVIFHGPVPFVSMPAYLKGLDIFLYTTAEKHLYQSPTKLFEYMAAGGAIISARTPQTQSLLKESETACFFDVGDSAQLANALLKLYENTELRRVLKANAAKEAKAKHTWSSRVSEILSNREYFQAEGREQWRD